MRQSEETTMRRLAMLLAMAGLFVGLANAQDGQPEARAVLDKAIKAHGGEAYLNKYPAATLKTKGRLEILGGFDFTQEMSYQMPDKFRDDMEFEIMGMKIRTLTVYNAGKAGLEVNGKKVDMGKKLDDTLKEAMELFEAGRLVGLRGKGYELSIVGDADVNGKPAVGIRVTKKGQRDYNLYFDKVTGLTVKTERRTIDLQSDQEITEERIVTEYQKLEGVAQPKKMVINRDGKKFLEAEIVELREFDKLDDGMFKVPQ
jgi:hypothetical protein